MNILDKIKRFGLYTGASTIAMLVDLFLFIVFAEILFRNIDSNISILLSTIISRVVSSTINFNLTKRALGSKNLKRTAIIRFFALVGVQLFTSAILVMILYSFIPLPKTIIKCVVDTTLYFIFYRVHSKYVFKSNILLLMSGEEI